MHPCFSPYFVQTPKAETVTLKILSMTPEMESNPDSPALALANSAFKQTLCDFPGEIELPKL
jgi:hypothetical protein